MYRKDFIDKQIEEFAKALALILTFKKANDWENFEKEIANASQQFTSLDIDFIENLNVEGFEKEVLNPPSLNAQQRKITADLLYEKMNLYLANNEQEKYLNLKNKCVSLYEFINSNAAHGEFNLEAHYRLEFLKQIQ
ncbi:MAG: hypothetical protein KF900_10220 [Bacteroidetes bacterium]|nr:hypothetical protein [Bacteroidota bacterium]